MTTKLNDNPRTPRRSSTNDRTTHPGLAHEPNNVTDPSALTTQQLFREIGTVREIGETLIYGINQNITTRIDGMDKAIELLQTSTDRGPNMVTASIERLQELHEEKFESIATQFKERDTRTEQTSRDSKVAVDAALQAAKEAVGEQNKSNALAIAKSEATFTKQIDQIGVLISTMQKGIDDKIDDIKTRLQAIESRKLGEGETRRDMGDMMGYLIGGVGMIVAIVALFLRK
jgi:cation transport regulator ChaB